MGVAADESSVDTGKSFTATDAAVVGVGMPCTLLSTLPTWVGTGVGRAGGGTGVDVMGFVTEGVEVAGRVTGRVEVLGMVTGGVEVVGIVTGGVEVMGIVTRGVEVDMTGGVVVVDGMRVLEGSSCCRLEFSLWVMSPWITACCC